MRKTIKQIIFLCLLSGLCSGLQAQVFRPLNLGVSYDVYSLGTYEDKLVVSYAGYKADSLNANFIALWDTVTYWDTMGTGLSGLAHAMTTYHDELYVGGNFNYAEGKAVGKIARWNGTEWNGVGTGIHTNIYYLNALQEYKGELYVGGRFREIGGVTGIDQIARWDGNAWKNMPGFSGSLPEVTCMTVYKGELYVGGRFLQAGATEAYYIAKWNGSSWSALGNGVDYTVHSMVVDTMRNLLYVGGSFQYAHDTTIQGRVACWDGARWYQMGDSSIFLRGGSVRSLEMYHNYLYAGGLSPKGLMTDTVFARWDGKRWEPITGINGNVTSLKTYNDELYLGGNFTKIDADSIAYLARYYSADTAEVIVGMPVTTASNTLILYPNPSKDKLIIQSDRKFNSLEVMDISGKIVLQVKKPNGNTISIQSLSQGTYVVIAVGDDNKVYTARIVKE